MFRQWECEDCDFTSDGSDFEDHEIEFDHTVILVDH